MRSYVTYIYEHIDGLTDREHHHHLGTNAEPAEHFQLDHGQPATRVYAYRGDWYAVHTH